MSVNTFRSSVDGPTVATIFVRLNMYSCNPVKGDVPRSRPTHPLTFGSFLQHRNRGKGLALDKLEECTAAR